MEEDIQKTINPEEKAKSNIFAMTFEKKKQGIIDLRKKNKRRGQIYLGISILLLIPFSILFLYPQIVSYISFNQNKNSIEKQIKDYEVTIADLQKTRDLHKAAYDTEYKNEESIIDKVFPATPDKLGVIELMEDFATELNAKSPPFEFTAISFENPKKENGYTVLPFQTTIHSSEENFNTFLGLVKLSGDYDPNSKDHIRLMEISNITLTYRGVDINGVDQGVDFNVKLNAYSR